MVMYTGGIETLYDPLWAGGGSGGGLSTAGAYAALPGAAYGSYELAKGAEKLGDKYLGQTGGEVLGAIAQPFGYQVNKVAKALGLGKKGGNKNALDASADAARTNENLDPLVRMIAQHGAPRGKHPEYWWNELPGWMDKIITDSPEALINLYSGGQERLDKINEDFKYVYGQGIPQEVLTKYKNLYEGVSELMGDDIDKNVISQLLPAYQESTKNGNAALAQWADVYKQSTPYLKKQAYKYSGDVTQVFNDLLARGATQGELDHFGQMLATGETDLYELSQYVQSLPEYQTKADMEFRKGLSDELQGYDTKFFNRATPELMSQYAKAGIQNSSALDFAMADLMGNIAENRGQYLAGLSSQQYGGNKAAARADYQAAMGQYLNELGQSRNRAYGLMDYYNQRGDAFTDYQRQRQDYMNYLNSMQSKKRGGVGSLIGGIAGGTAGALTGNPMWAMAGYQAGSGIGSYFG